MLWLEASDAIEQIRRFSYPWNDPKDRKKVYGSYKKRADSLKDFGEEKELTSEDMAGAIQQWIGGR